MPTNVRSLEDVLEDARTDAVKLKLHGHSAQANSLEHLIGEVADAMHDYLEWLSEDDAALQSAKSVSWLRSRFAEWESIGMARWDGHGRRARRLFRRVIVPHRPQVLLAYQEGRAS